MRDALAADPAAADVMICPPATLIARLAEAARGSALLVGAQDCHAAASGAHTGDISAEMLADAGATAVIVGHSERRADHGELDGVVREKVSAAHRARLTAIVCIGETAGERRAGLTLNVVSRQLEASLPAAATAAGLAIAYEPVWAIGTGLTPTLADVAEVHGVIRAALFAASAPRGRCAHSLRRLGQALERPRAPLGSQRQWRSGGRREPQGGRFSGHCPGLFLSKAECKDRA